MSERQGVERAVRASDAERERVAKLVGTAASEGRLDVAEAEDRLGRIYTTRFRHELAELVADLPEHRPVVPPNRFPARLLVHAVVAVIVTVATTLRWAAMDVPFFWPAGPMFLLWGSFALHALYVYAGGGTRAAAQERPRAPWDAG